MKASACSDPMFPLCDARVWCLDVCCDRHGLVVAEAPVIHQMLALAPAFLKLFPEGGSLEAPTVAPDLHPGQAYSRETIRQGAVTLAKALPGARSPP